MLIVTYEYFDFDPCTLVASCSSLIGQRAVVSARK